MPQKSSVTVRSHIAYLQVQVKVLVVSWHRPRLFDGVPVPNSLCLSGALGRVVILWIPSIKQLSCRIEEVHLLHSTPLQMFCKSLKAQFLGLGLRFLWNSSNFSAAVNVFLSDFPFIIL